ncbi:MAG: M48 family metallopeptidase [Bacteroidales bacterium]|jgi:hypothetical protein|nr:M48 family metallopeptidase [Bacteroidales bacterium]
MTATKTTYSVDGIEFRVIFSTRRTIGLSVLPDTSVIIRAPFFTSGKTIEKIVREKSGWILKHTENYRNNPVRKTNREFTAGEIHLYRGREVKLNCIMASKPFARIADDVLEVGLQKPGDPEAVRRLVERFYREEAGNILPGMFGSMLHRLQHYGFRPTGLIIRSMKRRWGSCSSKGMITLSTELIRVPEELAEYVIIHELCHLKHHNHGQGYYRLLSEVYPGYMEARKKLRSYIP